MKTYRLLLVTIFICVLIISGGAVFAEGSQESKGYKSFPGSHIDYWKLKAHDGLLIGGYGDNFVYSGERVVPVGGHAYVEVDARKNTGKMKVVFNGTINPEAGKSYTGKIKLVYERFEEGSAFWEGGIADYVYLHGDTGQEAPVMPTVKTDLASWGPVDVFVNGELIYDDLVGHMMYTEGSRDVDTYAIYNSGRSGYYSPMNPSDSSIAHPYKKELHFVAHTVEPDKGNFPPHTVWIHLNFLSVEELPFSPSGKAYGTRPDSL